MTLALTSSMRADRIRQRRAGIGVAAVIATVASMDLLAAPRRVVDPLADIKVLETGA